MRASHLSLVLVCWTVLLAPAAAADGDRYEEEFHRHVRMLPSDQAYLESGVGSRIEYLASSVENGEPGEAAAALRLLAEWDLRSDGRLDQDRVARSFRVAVFSDSKRVRDLGLYYLTQAGLNPRDEDLVLRVLALVRRGDAPAVRALGSSKDPSLMPYIRRAMDNPDGDKDLWLASSYALARLGDESYRLFWLDELHNTDPESCRQGLRAAAYIRDPRAMPRLVELLAGLNGEESGSLLEEAIPELAHKALVSTVTSLGKRPPVEPEGELRPRHKKTWERWWNANRRQILAHDGNS